MIAPNLNLKNHRYMNYYNTGAKSVSRVTREEGESRPCQGVPNLFNNPNAYACLFEQPHIDLTSSPLKVVPVITHISLVSFEWLDCLHGSMDHSVPPGAESFA
jgi:hypothetical protein